MSRSRVHFVPVGDDIESQSQNSEDYEDESEDGSSSGSGGSKEEKGGWKNFFRDHMIAIGFTIIAIIAVIIVIYMFSVRPHQELASIKARREDLINQTGGAGPPQQQQRHEAAAKQEQEQQENARRLAEIRAQRQAREQASATISELPPAVDAAAQNPKTPGPAPSNITEYPRPPVAEQPMQPLQQAPAAPPSQPAGPDVSNDPMFG